MKHVSVQEIDAKLQQLLDDLVLAQKITIDDIKNVIYHEHDKQGGTKLMLAFGEHAKTKKQLDVVSETLMLAWNYLPHQALGGLSPEQMVLVHHQKKAVEKPQPLRYNSKKTALYQLFEDDYPLEIGLEERKKHEWAFVFSQNYHKVHEIFHTLVAPLQADFYGSDDLGKKIEDLLRQEPHVMEAASYLAHWYFARGQTKKAATLLVSAIGIMKNLFPKEFDSKHDRLPWYFLENRDFLMLLFDRATFIHQEEGALAATPYFEEILSLNPNDNQGVRGIFASLYLKVNEPEKVIVLHKKYPGDSTPELVMGHALALIKLKKQKAVKKYLWEYMHDCEHVIDELLKPVHKPPQGYDPSRISMGGDDEAYLYWQNQGTLWQATPGALDMLRKNNEEHEKWESLADEFIF